MRTIEEKRAYARGYNTGSKGAWPDHRPPRPPDDLVSALVQASQELRDAVDTELATFLDKDEIVERFGPLVDAYDGAATQISTWLRALPTPGDET